VVNDVSQRPYLSIIVPAYNEAGSLKRTCAAMRSFLDAQGYLYEVILASDGGDETPAIAAEIASDWPNLALSLESGRHGKGHGIRRGAALANGDIVGFMDADYKTPIEEITRLLPWLVVGYDLAIGSRGVASSRIERRQPWFRRLGSRGFGVLMHAVVGLPELVDTQCGFKFFTRRAAVDIFSRTQIDGYMCDIEILYLANQLGYRVKEIGVVWSDDGDSRLDLVRGNMRNVIDLLRIRFGTRRESAPAAVPLPTPSVHPSRDP
jgi:glycosyltransferase involved in cell wall biosynthesis